VKSKRVEQGLMQKFSPEWKDDASADYPALEVTNHANDTM
jgi:hypothetical protein